MGNNIKRSGADGLALQITEPARSAGLVEENHEGDATYKADVRVYSFDDLLLLVDRDTDRVENAAVAELVASATRDTKSVYRAGNAAVTIAGHGYQVQLPPAEDAGFYVGTDTTVKTAPGVLVVHRDRSSRLAEDVVSIRRDQVQERMNHG
jgi:hypothetical protein